MGIESSKERQWRRILINKKSKVVVIVVVVVVHQSPRKREQEEEEEYPSISKFNSRDYLNFESTIRSSLKLNSNSPHVVGFYFVVFFFVNNSLLWIGLDWIGLVWFYNSISPNEVQNEFQPN